MVSMAWLWSGQALHSLFNTLLLVILFLLLFIFLFQPMIFAFCAYSSSLQSTTAWRQRGKEEWTSTVWFGVSVGALN